MKAIEVIRQIITQQINHLSKGVEESIIGGDFEISYSENKLVDITGHTIPIEIDGMEFEIWNSNSIKNTRIFGVKCDDFEVVLGGSATSLPDFCHHGRIRRRVREKAMIFNVKMSNKNYKKLKEQKEQKEQNE